MNPILTSALITAFTIAIANTGCAEQKDQEKRPPPQPAEAQPPPAAEEKPKDADKPAERRREAKAPEDRREARRADEPGRRTARPAENAVPFIGVVTRIVPAELAIQLGLDEGNGVLVEEVMPDSPSAKAGIHKFDVITQLNGERIREPGHLADLVRSKSKGDQVSLQVIRRSAKQEMKVAIDERPVPPGFGPGSGPWGRGSQERGPFGPWGYRFERWGQDEPWRDRGRDREPPAGPEAIDEMFRQSERFIREFQDQQRRLEQQLREYQERFQQQMREFQERMRERERDADRKEDPAPPRPDGPAMRRDRERDPAQAERRHVHVNVQVPGGAMRVTSGGVIERDDPSGHYRIEHHPEGEVTFTARTPDGKEQTWPVTTEAQRQALPGPFREKLKELDGVRIDLGPRENAAPDPEKTKTEA